MSAASSPGNTPAGVVRAALERANGCRGELWKTDVEFVDALAALDALVAERDDLAHALVSAAAARDDWSKRALLIEAERDKARAALESSGWLKCRRCSGRGKLECNCGDRQRCLDWCGTTCPTCKGTGRDAARAALAAVSAPAEPGATS